MKKGGAVLGLGGKVSPRSAALFRIIRKTGKLRRERGNEQEAGGTGEGNPTQKT